MFPRLPRGTITSALPMTTGNRPGCLVGCPKGSNDIASTISAIGPRSGSLYVLHLSRICLGTTRTTFGVNGARGTLACLGTVIAHTGPTGSMASTSLDLRHVLGREHGRLMNRNRTFFSCVHGNGSISHSKN